MPLTTGYIFPSSPGPSHKVYAIRSLVEMGEVSKPALPALVSLVKEVGSRQQKRSQANAVLGMAALRGIMELGPISQRDVEVVQASVECSDGAFGLVHSDAMRIVSLISNAARKVVSQDPHFVRPQKQDRPERENGRPQ